jgi:hypothetical protein
MGVNGCRAKEKRGRGPCQRRRGDFQGRQWLCHGQHGFRRLGLAKNGGRIAGCGNELAAYGNGVADSGGLSFVALGFTEGDGVGGEVPQLFPDGSGGDRSAQRPAFSIRRVQKLIGVLVVELEFFCVPIQFHAGYALGRDAEKHHFGELPAVVGEV